MLPAFCDAVRLLCPPGALAMQLAACSCTAQPALASYDRQRGFGMSSLSSRAVQCTTLTRHFDGSVLSAGFLSRSGLGSLLGCCYRPALRPWSGFPAFRWSLMLPLPLDTFSCCCLH